MVLAFALAMAAPALAAPGAPANTPCVSHCASNMGGQHVAMCAQTMGKGVSKCAQMTHAECMQMMPGGMLTCPSCGY